MLCAIAGNLINQAMLGDNKAVQEAATHTRACGSIPDMSAFQTC